MRASGGASALKGAGLIMRSAARAFSVRSAITMSQSPHPRLIDSLRHTSVVGVLEGGVPVLVEGADALDAVRVDG